MNDKKGKETLTQKIKLDDINWRIELLQNDCECWKEVLESEQQLEDEEREGIEEDVKNIKKWIKELEEERKNLLKK